MQKRNVWKRILAVVLTLTLVIGPFPENVGGFMTGFKGLVAHASSDYLIQNESISELGDSEHFHVFGREDDFIITISPDDRLSISSRFDEMITAVHLSFSDGNPTCVTSTCADNISNDGGSVFIEDLNENSVDIWMTSGKMTIDSIVVFFENMTKVEAVASTYTHAGSSEYYYNDDGTYYALSGNHYSEIEVNSWFIPAPLDTFNSSVEENPTSTLESDVSDNVKITRADGVLDLNGHTISGTVLLQNNDPNKTLTIKNGTIAYIDGEFGFSDYYSGNVVFENVTLTQFFWTDGHSVTINGGSYNMIYCIKGDASTSASMTIYDGFISGCLVNGGNLMNGWEVPDNGPYNITITGGKFIFDPSEYVPEGNTVFYDGEYWKILTYEKVAATEASLAVQGNTEYYVGNDGNYYAFDGEEYTEIEENSWLTPTLLEVFNSSNDDNPTLTFDEDFVGEMTITRDNGVVDVNGHTITGNLRLLNNDPEKTLTIKNGAITGSIDSTPFWDDYFKGKVVLENVNVGLRIWTDGHDYDINGGSVGDTIYSIRDDETTSNVVITGNFSGNALVLGYNDGTKLIPGGTFSISGGTFAKKPNPEFMAEGYTAHWNGSKFVVTADGLVEMTSEIVNPGFETGDTTGWEFKHSGGDSGAKDANNDIYKMSGSEGRFLFNTWNNGVAGWSIHQTVSGLPNGKYRLTATLSSSNGNKVALRANGIVSEITATGEQYGIPAAVDFYVTDGTATIVAEGVNNVWYKCDDFRLFYLDETQPEPVVAEENDYTSYIINPGFEYGSGYGWTYDNTADVNNIGVFYGVSPFTITGQTGDYIFNAWYNGVGYPISQTVTGLPEGLYRLMAVVGSTGTVVITANGETSEPVAEGEATVEFEVTDGTAIIGAEGVDDVWFKADDFRLYRIGSLVDFEVELLGDDSVYDGETAMFTVSIDGEENAVYTYQWYVKDLQEADAQFVLTDCTESTFTITADLEANPDGLEIYCKVMDSEDNCIESDHAVLTILPIPVKIVTQPEDYSGILNDFAEFCVEVQTAEGVTATYQWQYKDSEGDWLDFTNESATNAVFTIEMTEEMLQYAVRCLVSNGTDYVVVTDEVHFVAENPVAVITVTKQPTNWYGEKYGVKASFAVEATGEMLTYQWQYKKGSDEFADWSIATADTANLKVSLSTKTEKYVIRCEITDVYGNVEYTKEVRMMLEANIPIKITRQPANYYNAKIGKKATFTVVATGDELQYQWQWDKGGKWQDYSGATSDAASFQVSVNETTLKRKFRCEITDREGNRKYTEIVVIDQGGKPTEVIPLIIMDEPSNWVGKIGQKANFNVSATGQGLSYQWQYKKGTAEWTNYDIATANTANFYVTMNEKNMKWAFRCLITDADGKTATTKAVYLLEEREEPIPEGLMIIFQPSDFYGKLGKKASFNVTASGDGLTYEWQVKKSGSWSAYTLAGYDTPNFQVSINEKTVNWSYRCVIRDASGNEVATNEVHIYEEQ